MTRYSGLRHPPVRGSSGGCSLSGALAQLVERCLCMADVRGSTPLGSTPNPLRPAETQIGGDFSLPRPTPPGRLSAAWRRASRISADEDTCPQRRRHPRPGRRGGKRRRPPHPPGASRPSTAPDRTATSPRTNPLPAPPPPPAAPGYRPSRPYSPPAAQYSDHRSCTAPAGQVVRPCRRRTPAARNGVAGKRPDPPVAGRGRRPGPLPATLARTPEHVPPGTVHHAAHPHAPTLREFVTLLGETLGLPVPRTASPSTTT